MCMAAAHNATAADEEEQPHSCVERATIICHFLHYSHYSEPRCLNHAPELSRFHIFNDTESLFSVHTFSDVVFFFK